MYDRRTMTPTASIGAAARAAASLRLMIKHRQHHVWQHYLASWSIDERVWALRNGETIFNTDTVNVAVERDFYKVHKFTSRDLALLRLILSGPKHPAAKA